ncbi:MAG: pseudouridine synthase [Phycisphaerales bacterium]|nr:pseudouridine synthase [Phycisphaerales bacterium]
MRLCELLESRRLFASAVKPRAIATPQVVTTSPIAAAPKQIENLGRGLVAVNKGSGQVFVSWRLLANDPTSISFKLYRSTSGGTATLRAALTTTTNFTDTGVDGTKSNSYFVRPVVNGIEQAASTPFTLAANAPAQQFQYMALNKPADLTMPDGTVCMYSPNDASVGDVDGDGEYEMIVKWDPSNSKDNSQSGYTGNVYVDAYKMDGTMLWRIDLGRNIRAGAHYTQFIVYDLDGDGRAEIAMKTAPGTVDGRGNNVLMNSDSPAADYRNSSGYILSGPEYLTIFNGLTGANMATVAYNPPRGTVSSWGDSYGNRVDRFLAGVAYLDGERPSLIMSRGYYTRAVIAAWDWRGGTLTNRWTFDSNTAVNGSAYRDMGSHSMNIADVDGDGKDEIVYGAATIDDNGVGLYSTGWGHGDALHTGDLVPSNPGLETFMVHETPSLYKGNGGTMTDAKTGKLLWFIPAASTTEDVGRGVSFDVDPRYPGSESWDSSNSNVYKSDGTIIAGSSKGSTNFSVWWDGDVSQELLDDTTIAKWNTSTNRSGTLLNLYNATTSPVDSNNTTKATPMLSGDIFGDWREEVVERAVDGNGLYIFNTTTATSIRMPTLMHDVQYREAIAWQNVAYNQPPHPSFALGDGVLPTPNVKYVGDPAPTVAAAVVGDGSAQRSIVSSYSISFNEAVTLNAAGITVTNRGGSAVSFTLVASSDDKTYTLTFFGRSLADGVYDVVVLANAVRDSANNPLAGGNQMLTFHRLLGDGDGNRVIDFNDFLGLQNAFGTHPGDAPYRVEFDFDANGSVDFNDFLDFQNRFGFTV